MQNVIQKLSVPAREVIGLRRGYRTEGFSGSGERDLLNVLEREFSMGNTDALRFVQNTYGKDFGFVDSDESGYDVVENNPYYREEIEKWVKEMLGCSKERSVNCLWLATYAGVVNCYGGTAGGIAEYIIPDKHVVLSDLGTDGILVAFLEDPDVLMIK